MSLNIRLFFTFFQIGLFSIGGGYAIIPLIQQEIVEKASWISQKAFTDMITISQMTPGPLAVNASTFVGLQTAGLPGAILATTGCILAGVCISAGLYSFFLRHEDSRRLSAALNGLKSASLGLIVSAAASILLLAFTGSSDWTGPAAVDLPAVILFAASFWLLRRRKFNPILVMSIAGIAGGLLYR
ncbi:chromate transporter [Bariatricus massiliensis]|uniref:Chromate transporter n=1 Tax=Bariatricus massiliensis TaxID=1745713 RepID=A0ABS8DE17_9FIRM|nr:chromate transporter [Bariatricus massiliensis]MCB7302770.1 chromate transporter [Bariatricus massiliensis]MCB7373986.1 chromate transporter [Bariatricus massiliensis]MCB7386656.1 chromate transporter [Bariatricus massiliensis]MCB7410818.1 chromate transporter [Bariatricus massiliensis]MCQ5251642.1 chromate transporter [Bariatricus massiliensis]